MISRIFFTVRLALGAMEMACGVVLGQQTGKTLWQPYYISPRVAVQHLTLAGKWDLGYRDVPINNLEDLRDQPKWICAAVPSSVQWALYQAGELPHPYYHLNSQKYTWVPDKVWYYRRRFQVPVSAEKDYVFLCFDGLGYYSKIWLNGELLGRHEGTFGGPDVEVSKNLHFGSPNELVVEVKAASYGVADWGGKSSSECRCSLRHQEGNPYVTGNGGIRTKEFLPFGIWTDVRLEIVPPTHLERPFLVTEVANTREARLALTQPAFFTDVNIAGTKQAFYGTDNFFWFPAGEERRLQFEVLWRDLGAVDRAYMTAKAWNSPSIRATMPPR